jgi:hypothetical protein
MGIILGTGYIFLLIIMFLLVLVAVTSPLHKHSRIQKVRKILIALICWNKILRFFIETSIVLAFSMVFSFDGHAYPTNFATGLDFAMTILVAGIFVTLPVFILVFY